MASEKLELIDEINAYLHVLPVDLLQHLYKIIAVITPPPGDSCTAHKIPSTDFENSSCSTDKIPKTNTKSPVSRQGKPKRNVGFLMPEDEESLFQLKESVLTESFWSWYQLRQIDVDVEVEWERFVNNWLLTRRRFRGKTLERSCYLAFQNWLTSPYQHSGNSTRRLGGKKSPQTIVGALEGKVKIAQELKRQAREKSVAEKTHWFKIWTADLKAAGIDLQEVSRYVK